MITILSLYLLLLAVAVAGAFFVYRGGRRFGRGRAILAGAASLALAILFCPLPVHHGFTTVLDILLSELGREKVAVEAQIDTARQQAFRQRLAKRFAGPLPYAAAGPAQDGWQPVTVAGGGRGWLELEHQLIWSEAFPWREWNDFSLEKPRAFCRALAPAGFWTLPSEAEMALFWRAGGAEVSGVPAFNAVAFSADEKLQSEMPSVHLGDGGRRFLRCVARTEQAPMRGYIDADIPLADWNSYQLAKTAGREK